MNIVSLLRNLRDAIKMIVYNEYHMKSQSFLAYLATIVFVYVPRGI